MKRIDLTPTFLQDNIGDCDNPIIKTEFVVKIRLDGQRIVFKLTKTKQDVWNFNTAELSKQAYIKIKEQLKDVKMIV